MTDASAPAAAPSAPASPTSDIAEKAADLQTQAAAVVTDAESAAAEVLPAAKTLEERIADVLKRTQVGTHASEAFKDLAEIVRDLHDMVVKPQTPAAPPKQ